MKIETRLFDLIQLTNDDNDSIDLFSRYFFVRLVFCLNMILAKGFYVTRTGKKLQTAE